METLPPALVLEAIKEYLSGMRNQLAVVGDLSLAGDTAPRLPEHVLEHLQLAAVRAIVKHNVDLPSLFVSSAVERRFHEVGRDACCPVCADGACELG